MDTIWKADPLIIFPEENPGFPLFLPRPWCRRAGFTGSRVVISVAMIRLIPFVLVIFLALPAVAGEISSPVVNFLKGYRAEIRGKYDEALDLYRAALRLDPGSVQLRAEIALLFIKKGDVAEAEKILTEALSIRENDRDVMVLLASIYGARGEFEKAKAIYEKCLAANGEDTEAYLYLGSLYMSEKKYDEAIQTYEKIIGYDEDNIMALYYLARLHAEKKSYDTARDYYLKVIDLRPNFEPALIDLGTLYEVEGDFDKAIEYYQRIVSFDPSNKKARSRIATIFVKKKQYNRAIHEFEKLSDLDREDVTIRVKIGLLHLEEERYDEAIREFNIALAANSQNNAVRYYLAMAWRGKGDTKRATEEFLKIDPKSEEFSGAIKSLVFLHIKSGSVDDGITIVKGYLEKIKDNPDIYMMLALLYEEKQEFAKAIALLADADRISPGNVEILYQLGMLHEREGKTDRALAYMEEVLKIDKDYANALNFIGYTWADQNINLPEAEGMIRRALDQKPDDPYIRDSLGWVYYRKGEFEKALAEMLRAFQALPDDPTIAEHLGDVYVALGQFGKALEYFNKALGLEKKEDKKKQIELKKKITEEKMK